MKKIIASIIAITATAFLATAAEGDKPAASSETVGKKGEAKRAHASPEEVFKKKDTNGDGTVSLEEFRALAEAMFKKKDKDGDGKITKEEFSPAPKAKGKKKKNQ